MVSDKAVGTLSGLWIFPVKSMRGMRIEEAIFTKRGLLGDRAYALIDKESGKVASAKSVKNFPELFACEAAFLEPPQEDHEVPPVRITLPDGRSVRSDAGDGDAVLSDFFKRDVTLAKAAPEDFTIDQYHPDIEGADPAGHRDSVIEQKVGAAYFAEAGLDSPVPAGSFLDLFPVTLLTTSTLDRMAELEPESRFDERRFRMNIIVSSNEAGFVENDWVGHGLVIGDELRLSVVLPDPRCVMTTLAQEDLPRDINILRALVRHNKIPVGDEGLFPCAGVYAVVEKPGLVRLQDRVFLT